MDKLTYDRQGNLGAYPALQCSTLGVTDKFENKKGVARQLTNYKSSVHTDQNYAFFMWQEQDFSESTPWLGNRELQKIMFN